MVDWRLTRGRLHPRLVMSDSCRRHRLTPNPWMSRRRSRDLPLPALRRSPLTRKRWKPQNLTSRRQRHHSRAVRGSGVSLDEREGCFGDLSPAAVDREGCPGRFPGQPLDHVVEVIGDLLHGLVGEDLRVSPGFLDPRPSDPSYSATARGHERRRQASIRSIPARGSCQDATRFGRVASPLRVRRVAFRQPSRKTRSSG